MSGKFSCYDNQSYLWNVNHFYINQTKDFFSTSMARYLPFNVFFVGILASCGNGWVNHFLPVRISCVVILWKINVMRLLWFLAFIFFLSLLPTRRTFVLLYFIILKVVMFVSAWTFFWTIFLPFFLHNDLFNQNQIVFLESDILSRLLSWWDFIYLFFSPNELILSMNHIKKN